MSRNARRLVLGSLCLMWLIACGPSYSPTVEPRTDLKATTTGGTGEANLPTASLTEPTATAGRMADANVLHVRAVQAGDASWTFHVTVQHPDTGWEDYADGWAVVTPDGTVLKPDPDSPYTRLLLHPHEDEQPFTRSQSGIVLPPGVEEVHVRAHDLLDGYGGREVWVDLTATSGPDFEVQRMP